VGGHLLRRTQFAGFRLRVWFTELLAPHLAAGVPELS
jgi:hypothetical protein